MKTRMIQTKTPLRISLAGGGTDMPKFYEEHGGAVIATAINQFIRIYFSELRKNRVVVSSVLGLEYVDDAEKIRNPIVREALVHTDLKHGISIRIESDVTPHGCGLGTSSALTVGLVQGLMAFKGQNLTPYELAEEACKIEIEKLGKPIGKQDQYIAAYGGVKHLTFYECGDVQVEDMPIYPETLEDFRKNLMLFDTDVERKAAHILGRYDSYERLKNQIEIKKLVQPMYDLLTNPYENLDEAGLLLHKHWGLKRGASKDTSNPLIDKVYNVARAEGAIGGRLLGAGGGGHFLFYVPTERQMRVGTALTHLGLKQIPFRFHQKGSEVYDSDNSVRREGNTEASGYERYTEDFTGA